MKVIDLLKKIENGENIPKKIKVYQEVFEWDILEHYYKRSNGDDLLELCTIFNTGELLSMEVELIEDEIDIDSIEHKELEVLQEMLGQCDLFKGNEKYILKVINENNSRLVDAILKVSKENETLVQAVKQINKEVKKLKEDK